MLDIFRGLKNLIKVSHVHIDSTIFRLHYTFTVMCLLAFSLIVTTRQYVGNPIDCVHTKDIPEDVLNTYCWIHSTYTIPSAFWKRIGIDVAHPGIDKTVDPEERRYVKYYQWVCFCLFFQVGSSKRRRVVPPWPRFLEINSLDHSAYKMSRTIDHLRARANNPRPLFSQSFSLRGSLDGADLSDTVRRICSFATSTSHWPACC